MPISHVEYGKEADPTHQNALIDQVNQNTSDITTLQGEVAGKAELCSDLPEDTGITPAVGSSAKASPCNHKHRAVGSASPQAPGESASAGTASLASRQDHVHPGVSKIIAGTGIGVSPASGRGDVTVTCTGAGPAISTKTVNVPAQTLGYGTADIELWDAKPNSILGVKLSLTLSASGGDVGVTAILVSDVSYGELASSGLIFLTSGQSGTVTTSGWRGSVAGWSLADSKVRIQLRNSETGSAVITSGTITIYYL